MTDIDKPGFQQWYRENIAGRHFNTKAATRMAWIHQKQRIESLQAEIERLNKCIDWALRANHAGMPGYVPDLLHGRFDCLNHTTMYGLNHSIYGGKGSESVTLQEYIEAVERSENMDRED